MPDLYIVGARKSADPAFFECFQVFNAAHFEAVGLVASPSVVREKDAILLRRADLILYLSSEDPQIIFETAHQDASGKWRRGAPVHLDRVEGMPCVKTGPHSGTADFLPDLPEF